MAGTAEAPFTALADPTRRMLFEAIGDGERSVGELVEVVRLTQPAVSQHLKVLRDHGLVKARPAGQRRLYSINPDPLSELDAWLARYRHLWSDRLDALVRHLEEHPK